MNDFLFIQLPEIERYDYKPIGKCIYCGSTSDLTDEHIVPFGLGGNLVLPKSSCKICAELTSKFELSVQRGSMQPVRVYRKIQSRKKHKTAPDNLSISIEKNNKSESIEFPLGDYPIIAPFPIFSVPGYLLKRKETKGIYMQGIASISFGMRPDDFLKKYGATRFTVELAGDKPSDFAKMIAKIAFSMAVATGAFKNENIDYSKSFVLPAILGKKDDIGHWVGTLTSPIMSSKYPLHKVIICPDKEKGLLIGYVQIFSDSESPIYGVILSKLN